jgi:hypothetical protein
VPGSNYHVVLLAQRYNSHTPMTWCRTSNCLPSSACAHATTARVLQAAQAGKPLPQTHLPVCWAGSAPTTGAHNLSMTACKRAPTPIGRAVPSPITASRATQLAAWTAEPQMAMHIVTSSELSASCDPHLAPNQQHGDSWHTDACTHTADEVCPAPETQHADGASTTQHHRHAWHELLEPHSYRCNIDLI